MPFKPGQGAIIETKRAKLSEDFGRELLTKKFTYDGAAMVLAMFGNVSRGPRKGQPRGFIIWSKCIRGGWTRDNGMGRVQRPGAFDFHVSLAWEGGKIAPARANFAEAATHAEYMEYLCRALNVCKDNWNHEKGTPVKACEFWNRWHVAAEADRKLAADTYRAQLREEARRQEQEEADIDTEIERRSAAKAANAPQT